MPNLPDDDTRAVSELEEIINSDRLVQIFDQLEPRAKRLVNQPSAVAFGMLFGSIGVFLGIVLGYFANLYYSFPWYLILLCTGALTSGGIAYGNIRARGKAAIKLERKGQAIANFLRPLFPILERPKPTPETRKVKRQLAEGIKAQLDKELEVPQTEPGDQLEVVEPGETPWEQAERVQAQVPGMTYDEPPPLVLEGSEEDDSPRPPRGPNRVSS